MKIISTRSTRLRCRVRGSTQHPSTDSGFALVIVLVMLTLMAIVLVAFLSSASSELRSAKSYALGLDVRALSDSAVNIVTSQIQDATATPTTAWASQPGMIRTYDTAGAPVTAYKLYSADQLRVTGAYNPSSGTDQSADVPSNWSTLPNQYVDLNKPVVVSGVSHYPIIDPSAVANGQASTTAMDGSTSPIQGCYLDTLNAATITSVSQANPVPMPVKWLYILQDGSITTISSASTVSNATSGNPIVGRIAFWTDDECSKVNVNTSGEGTFYDRPMADSAAPVTPGIYAGYEQNFLNYSLPAQNEFQRYPGHPAMTSLSVIFPPLAGETAAAYNERIYGIIPKLATGGSKSGTVASTSKAATPVPNTARLFSSVDEFLFGATGVDPRTVNLKGPGTNFTDSDIQKTRFFLTASSRSPEVNMFNKPRIALWPLQANTANVSDPVSAPNRTAKDKLIAFCSTVGSNPYYFQRYNTYDPTQVRTAAQSYPASLTQNPIPSSQSPSMDWSLIPRNQSLYSYLQYLTSSPIPGIGGSLSGSGGKYATSVRDQILTEMFDFIRSEVTTATTGATPSYFYAPGQTNGTLVTGERQVVPLEITPPGAGYTTKGFGRFETITQMALVFYRKDAPTITGSTTTQNPVTPSTATPINIGVALLFSPFNPTPGTRAWCENMRIVLKGMDGMLCDGQSVFPSSISTVLTGINNSVNLSAWMGPEFFFRYNNIGGGTGYRPLGATTPGSPTEEQFYPFSGSFTIAPPFNTTSFFRFSPPTNVTLEIYSGYDTAPPTSSALVQTINLTFPTGNVNLPLPTASSTTYNDFNARIGSTPMPAPSTSLYPAVGIDDNFHHNPSPYIQPGDTVRSIEVRYKGPAQGDLRVFTGLATVPGDYLEGHGMIDTPADGTPFSNTTATQIHSMRIIADPLASGNNFGQYLNCGGPLGLLFSGAPSYYQVTSHKYSLYPFVPRGLTATQVQLTGLDGSKYPGDWDTGPGDHPDGPYINKPDESNSAYMGAYSHGSLQGTAQLANEQGNTYSPNRQICSAVAFGSLPTGIDPANSDASGSGADQTSGGIRPWQTLLFCANPAAGVEHPGNGKPVTASDAYTTANAPQPPPYQIPPDSAFLDFFTMPVVEPYAISEPFSTAGKVNMNYQIVPFTYLTRDTAVRSVLKSTRMMAMSPTYADGGNPAIGCYKVSEAGGPPDFRYTINPDEVSGTLAGFQMRFNSGDIFRSAAEICGIYLVPQYLVTCATSGAGETVSATVASGSPTYSTMNTWWKDYTLTGDNVKETPYNQIYPRLTTKSNSYTVHVMCQTLKKVPTTAANQFVEGQDQITSEYRGSYVVQRYLDPNSDSLVKADGKTPGSETDPNSMVGPYKFRVVGTKRFAP